MTISIEKTIGLPSTRCCAKALTAIFDNGEGVMKATHGTQRMISVTMVGMTNERP